MKGIIDIKNKDPIRVMALLMATTLLMATSCSFLDIEPAVIKQLGETLNILVQFNACGKRRSTVYKYVRQTMENEIGI